MAGIGFKLKEMVKKKTFAEWLKLYTYSAVIFSGPWLISIMCLGAMSIFALPELQYKDIRLFTVTVVYIYSFSLIFTGAILLLITRYVSDQIYIKKSNKILPTFIGSLILIVPVQTIIGVIFLFMADLTLLYKIISLALYITISIIWIEMIFLGAVKNYDLIVIAFALGYTGSFIGAQFFGKFFGLDGYITGFFIGQIFLMSFLMYRIFVEYKVEEEFSMDFLKYYKRYPSLIAIGLIYNAAIWIDKIIFWYSSSGLHVHSLFYTHFPYDSSMFVAYLTIVPAVAIFLLRIETDFYLNYKNYYGTIINRGDLRTIVFQKEKIISILKNSLLTAVIYQGSVTLGIILIMPYILSLFRIDPVHVPIFRVATLGAFFHIHLLILLIILLYFDFRGSALITASLFFITNSVFAKITIELGEYTHGYGYLFASFLSLLVGLFILIERVKNLEYLTFMRQPVF